jgi:orotate phosphoribosyltransferase
MTNKDILNIFRKCNALKEGHFLLTSGLHSEVYFQKNLVLQYPKLTKKLAKELAVKFDKDKIDVVLSPAVGAIVLGYQLASILKCKFLFAEREKGKLSLRRGFNLPPKARVLIVEDVITTGGSVQELVRLVNKAKARLIGVACLVDRSQNKVRFNKMKPKGLLTINVKNYPPSKCPLCKKGIKISKPGSRNI